MSSRSSSNSHSHRNLSFTGYHRVGFIRSAHGIRGELFIGLFAGQADWEASELHLLKPGADALEAFEIEHMKPHKDGLIAKLKGVNTRNDSEALRKSQIYISEDVLQSPEGEPIFLAQISGFELADKEGVKLGEITGFATNGPQDLLEVRAGSGSALVPFIDEFIVDIDFDKKQVRMDLPPGLLNVEEE